GDAHFSVPRSPGRPIGSRTGPIAPARQFPRYDFPDSGVLQAGSEPGLWANACRFGLNLSGVTPGEREYLAIRRVTAAAQLRRSGPARLDSLQRAAAMC